MVGRYESKKVNIFKEKWLSFECKGNIIGEKLFLRKDSTYDKKGCGKASRGRWHVKGDSLVLVSEINFAWPEWPDSVRFDNPPEAFYIRADGDLYKVDNFYEEPKKMLEYLEKKE